MRIYLIRHGQTQGGEVLRYKGHTDVPLSDVGRAQILRLSEYLEKKSIDEIYCSDLSRAIDSACIIADKFNLKPIIMPEFRERHFGRWEGMTFDEINNLYPDDFKNWASDPLRFSPIDGESTLDVSNRIMPALETLINKQPEKNMLILAHGGVNRVILCNLLKIPLEHVFRIEQDFAALNIIEFYNNHRGTYPVIKLLNYTPNDNITIK